MKKQDFLSFLLKTTQAGQIEIRSILDSVMCPSLRSTLEAQLWEYDSIETEVYSIALQRGWELKELDPVIRRLTNRATRIRLTGRSTDSRIADIMIRRNTAAFIKGLQNFNALQNDDMQIRILSQKLLDCETAGIRKLQTFL